MWAVARVLVACAGQRGCFPKQRTIADKCGYSLRAVNSAIAWLKQRGLLVVRHRGNTSAIYTGPVEISEETVENQQLSFDFAQQLRSELRSTPITLSDSSTLQGSTVECRGEAPRPETLETNAPENVSGAFDELRRTVRAFRRGFALTSDAERALLDRLNRKARYWKRPLVDVVVCLGEFLRSGKHRPRAPGWFTTVVETRFAALARSEIPKKPVVSPRAPSYAPNQGEIQEWSAAIADLARSKCMGMRDRVA